MEENNKSGMTFNISGGTVQIAPNATMQQQNFYGCTADELQPGQMSGNDLQSVQASPLALYINNVEVLADYTARLAACTSARELGLVVVDMVKDDRVKVDSATMVKQSFIERILPLALQVTTKVANVRKYINEAWSSWRK